MSHNFKSNLRIIVKFKLQELMQAQKVIGEITKIILRKIIFFESLPKVVSVFLNFPLIFPLQNIIRSYALLNIIPDYNRSFKK